MDANPIWFGDKGRALAGWLHLPEGGRARAGVVLCPTLGVEALMAYPAYRRIAVELASIGFAVLRFEYRGTGDSMGSLRTDASVEAWLEDVAAALAHLRSCGVKETALLGLRVGATLAAGAAARDGDVGAVVLWDPCTRGKSFVREQQALKALSLGETPVPLEEGIELAAMLLPTALAAELRALEMPPVEAHHGHQVLVLGRAERPVDGQLEAVLAKAPAQWRVAPGQPEFIDVDPGLSVLPEQMMREITDWFDGAFKVDGGAEVVSRGASEVVLAGPCRGEEIVERAISIGDDAMFGILSEPTSGGGGPTVLLLSVGLLHHIGPGRMWVELARRWAGEGRRVLRFDLAGIGDSPEHAGRRPHIAYPVDAVEDVRAAATAVSPSSPRDVVLAGVCSGAYHSVEGALVLRPAGVLVVNPVFSFIPPELRENGVVAEARAAMRPPNGLVRWMRDNPAVVRLAKWPPLDRLRYDERLARIVDEATPEWLWRLLGRIGVTHSPTGGLASLIRDGTDALVVCGALEARPFRRARGAIEAMRETGTFQFEVLDDIDHSLFGAAARGNVCELLSEHLKASFPLLPPRPAPVPVLSTAGKGPKRSVPEVARPGGVTTLGTMPVRPTEASR